MRESQTDSDSVANDDAISGQASLLYIDLLKKALTFSLWPEPPIPIETFNYRRSRARRAVVKAVAGLLRRYKYVLSKETGVSDHQREEGAFWPLLADTMIGMKRLNSLQKCIETVLSEDIPGDFIETGVWRGGACIFMRGLLAAHNIRDRRVFVADSFRGLPPPDQRYAADRGDQHHRHEFLAVSEDVVKANFARYGLLDDQVVFLPGWFSETLPASPIDALSILRLDGDMYASTVEALRHLYPKLSRGGYCIVDDYALEGCRQAVDDYREEHRIDAAIHLVDWTGAWWRK